MYTEAYVYSVIKDNNDGTYECNKINVKEFRPRRFIWNLPWSRVGIYKYCGVNPNVTHTVDREDILGKAVICKNFISLSKPDWFMSKF